MTLMDSKKVKEIISNLELLHDPGEVIEIRMPKTKKGTISGYYTDFLAIPHDIAPFMGKNDIYVTLNPVNPVLLARCCNHLQFYAKETSKDSDIKKITNLLIDIDPRRPAGISSTDEEKVSALNLVKKILIYLKKQGFPPPILSSSGNGYHLVFAVELENTNSNVLLVKRFLMALDFLFSNDQVEVDRTTFNPARIVKLYGTLACKGDDLEDRPHRYSRIITAPDVIEPVNPELLETVAAELPEIEEVKKRREKGNHNFNLDEWLDQNKIAVALKAPYQDNSTKYILETCPWNSDHTDRSAYIIRFANGAIAAGCHHNGCSGQNWQSLRKLFDQTESDGNYDDGDGKLNQSQILLQLGSDFKFFCNDLEEPYIAVNIEGHWEVMFAKSERFKAYLLKLFFDKTGSVPNADVMAQVLKVFVSKALFSNDQRKLQTRISTEGDGYFYDLCNPEWSVVKITDQGYFVEKNPPVLFTRSKNMKMQEEPTLMVKPRMLYKLVKKHFLFKNKQDRILFSVYLASCFLPQIAHVILILYGEKGSAKSTTIRMLKRIVDPAMRDLRSMPSSKQDLAIFLANTYLPAFDNLDNLSAEKSDLLCMTATGGAFSKRTLYSDCDETILSLKRCVALNGINIAATRPDLLDRSIILELIRISKSDRKTEEAIWADFEADIPDFLGAIFSTISAVIKLRKTVELEQVGRMADFSFWGYAIAEVLGIGGDSFISAYLNNQERANEEALNSNPVAAAVIAFMDNKNKWSGSVSLLLNELDCIASLEHINTIVKTWPKDPSALSKRLKEIKSNLEEIGIFYDIRHAGNFKEATIENRNVPPPEPPVPRHKKKR